jgi:hypothetical protein
MLRRNATISSVTVDGAPVFTNRRVLMQHASVQAQVTGVEIMPEASTAMAPMLDYEVTDRRDSLANGSTPGWARGDIVTFERFGSRSSPPNANPFHVMRTYEVQVPGQTVKNVVKVALSRLDMLTQTVTWWPALRATTAAATRAASYDANRQQVMSAAGTDKGIGWTWVDTSVTPHVAYNGYGPKRTITIAINEYATMTEMDDSGLISYEHPVLLIEEPSPFEFAKYDVIGLADGRRLVVADLQHKLQRDGVVLATLIMTEQRASDNMVYDLT